MSSPLDFIPRRAAFGRAVRVFAAQVAAERQGTWPITLTLADSSEVEIAKAPTTSSRVPEGLGAGYVQRNIAQFLFPACGEFLPTLGAEWEITASEIPAEIGTRWRCFEVQPSGAGTEHRAVCFRLD